MCTGSIFFYFQFQSEMIKTMGASSEQASLYLSRSGRKTWGEPLFGTSYAWETSNHTAIYPNGQTGRQKLGMMSVSETIERETEKEEDRKMRCRMRTQLCFSWCEAFVRKLIVSAGHGGPCSCRGEAHAPIGIKLQSVWMCAHVWDDPTRAYKCTYQTSKSKQAGYNKRG